MEAPRAVTTDHRDGSATFVGDGPLPVLEVPGARIWRLLRLDGPARSPSDGTPSDGPPVTLPPGGMSIQLVDLLPRNGPAAWRTARTFDIHVVVDGELVVELEEGEVVLAPGDTLIQRGTTHRMHPGGGHPVRFLGAHLMPGPGAPDPLQLLPASDGRSGVRRVVTGNVGGRSTVVHDGEPASVFRPGASVLTDVWETGGPVTAVDQGGDPTCPWHVEPVGGGTKVGIVELPPGDYTAEANWHATATIDVDVILSGRVELHLPDQQVVALAPGDAVVQRGTLHRWQPLGDVPLRMATIMVTAGR